MRTFIRELKKSEASALSPVTLAFLGDAVYSLYVREKLVLTHDVSAGELQSMNSALVSAHGQNALLLEIRPLFTEEEESVYKRGRNAKKPSHSKNAEVAEYNNSTGLEALFGWLYVTGQSERLLFLMSGGKQQ